LLINEPGTRRKKALQGRLPCRSKAEYLAEEEGVRRSEAGRGMQAANLLVKKERRQQVRRKAGC
jgi:hypothetical protein